jgi:peptidoglycan/xylan/chitin deacetylase (PgdA/CDA1 family)
MSATTMVRFLRVLQLEGLAIRIADRLRLRRGRGGSPAFPFIRRSRRPSFQILVYHRVNDERTNFFPGVPVDRFRKQMEVLARNATVLPLGELVDRVRGTDLPPRSVAITFDDGYRDNYECAYPVLRALQLPATIFLATNPLDTGAALWHDRVFDAFERSAGGTLRILGRSYVMAPLEARRRTLVDVLTLLRSLRPEERDSVIDGIERQVGGTVPNGAARMLSWDSVQEMAGNGITFGAHTVSHPILTRLTREEAEHEIRASRASIESRLGRPVDLFAYPNGTRADFDGSIQQILRDQGFRCAVTTLWGVNDAACDPFELRRIGFWNAEADLIPLRLAWYRFGG